jgi:hypothetical protein
VVEVVLYRDYKTEVILELLYQFKLRIGLKRLLGCPLIGLEIKRRIHLGNIGQAIV